jgi:hypothetical protein
LIEIPLCKNPECNKEVPEDREYCDNKCFERHSELRKLKRNGILLTQEDDIWLGQTRRKRAMEIISRLAKEMCPLPFSKFVSFVSYKTGLSRRKVETDYLETLLDVEILELKEGILQLKEN